MQLKTELGYVKVYLKRSNTLHMKMFISRPTQPHLITNTYIYMYVVL